MIGNLDNRQIELLVNILLYIFTCSIGFLTIITVFSKYFNSKYEENIVEILNELQDYSRKVIVEKELYDRYRLLRDLYRRYENVYSAIVSFENMLGGLSTIYKLSAVIAGLTILLAMAVSDAWNFMVIVVVVLLWSLIECIVLFEDKLVAHSRMLALYPTPSDFLNPYNIFSVDYKHLGYKANLLMDIFYYGIALTI